MTIGTGDISKRALTCRLLEKTKANNGKLIRCIIVSYVPSSLVAESTISIH